MLHAVHHIPSAEDLLCPSDFNVLYLISSYIQTNIRPGIATIMLAKLVKSGLDYVKLPFKNSLNL